MTHGGKRPGAGRRPNSKPSAALVSSADADRDQIAEPDWSTLFDDDLDLAVARQQWRVVLRELREAEKLTPANAHQIRRYVIFCVQFEVAARHVAEEGAVFPRKGKKQPAYNPWFTVMKDASQAALQGESELTISVRRRDSGGKVRRRLKLPAAADEFLRVIPGGRADEK